MTLSTLPSTLRRVVSNKPEFNIENKIGRYERLPSTSNKRVEAGLRLQHKYKTSSSEYPLITYITIVRNNKKGILRCMESVWAQDYDNIEYIVIDGNSDDGTVDIIMQHIDKIDYFVSEPDLGIYNAFNKGLSLASGKIINILNSDDSLYEHAAKNAVSSLGGSDILFGAAMYYDQEGKQLYPYNPFEMHEGTIFIGTPVCHNAVYATKMAYEQIGYYREDIKIAADFKWILDAWNHQFDISYCPHLLVKYSLGGASDNINKFFDDMQIIIKEYYPELSTTEIMVLLNTFCMFLPAKVIQNKEKELLNQIINKHKQNQNLILSILKSLVVKTYQYDSILHEVSHKKYNLKYFERVKDYIYLNTKNTVFHRPLKKIYRSLKRSR